MVFDWYTSVRIMIFFGDQVLTINGNFRQNNVQELYSLFKFLRIKPLNDAQAFDVQIGKPLTTGRNAGQALKKLRVGSKY